MGNLAGRSNPVKARKTKNVFPVLVNLFFIVLILLVTGCVPSVNSAFTVASESTQVSAQEGTQSSGSSPALPVSGNATTAATATPSAVPTNTPGPKISLTFVATADAYAKQSEPRTNYGKKSSLQVDSGKEADEGFVEFTIKGISGAVQSAVLRLYTTKNGSQDGPAVYATTTAWAEKELTWDKRPIPDDKVLDNKHELDTETWAEYDVTSAVQGNGTFTFVLRADSEDAITFSSREGTNPPELVVTFIPDALATARATVPSSGENEDVTFVGAGDISACNTEDDELTAELVDNIPGTVFTLGDNAYDDGEYRQYVDCYTPTWGRFKDRTYPIPGNHDYHTADAAGYYQYFENIPPYYAYDLGGWRIYALNSEIDSSIDSPQIRWLQIDLATHPSKCVLAYWHQPRWSSGSTHGSSLRRQVLWETLYKSGAELVLSGHEHNYERFMPMDAEGNPDPFGMRQFVVGTGGDVFYPFGTPLPTSEVRNNTTHGVLKLTLHSDSYDWEFIPVAGSTFTDSGSQACH